MFSGRKYPTRMTLTWFQFLEASLGSCSRGTPPVTPVAASAASSCSSGQSRQLQERQQGRSDCSLSAKSHLKPRLLLQLQGK